MSETTPDRSLLITGFGNQLFALNRENGQIRWEVSFGEEAGYREVELAIHGGVVIAATSRDLAFIDYATGQIHGHVQLKHESGRATMLVDGAHVYVSGDGNLSCFTLRGVPVWTQHFDGRGGGSLALGLPGNVRQADDVGNK